MFHVFNVSLSRKQHNTQVVDPNHSYPSSNHHRTHIVVTFIPFPLSLPFLALLNQRFAITILRASLTTIALRANYNKKRKISKIKIIQVLYTTFRLRFLFSRLDSILVNFIYIFIYLFSLFI